MAKIYVVMGESGSYDDYASWMEKGFFNREAAEAHIPVLLARDRRKEELTEKLSEHQNAWYKDHPSPVLERCKAVPHQDGVKKWASKQEKKAHQQTPEWKALIAARRVIEKQNEEINQRNHALNKQWANAYETAKNELLVQLHVSDEEREWFKFGYYSWRDESSYSIKELEVE